MSRFYEGDSRRWLFAFAHPDDEIAAAALIARLTAAGVDVFCGWSVAPKFRESEARATMKRLNVPQENLFFFQFPDGQVCEQLSELATAWKCVINTVRPTDVVVCAFECGHLDHDSTNYAVCAAATEIENDRIYEYPLYHTYLTRSPTLNRFADSVDEMVLELTADEQKLKWEVACNYPTQNIASLLIWYTVAGSIGLRPKGLKRTERYRERVATDFLQPLLPADLRNKVIGCEKWQRWTACVERAISHPQSAMTN